MDAAHFSTRLHDITFHNTIIFTVPP